VSKAPLSKLGWKEISWGTSPASPFTKPLGEKNTTVIITVIAKTWKSFYMWSTKKGRGKYSQCERLRHWLSQLGLHFPYYIKNVQLSSSWNKEYMDSIPWKNLDYWMNRCLEYCHIRRNSPISPCQQRNNTP
jgi:hypothetical protein